MPRYQIHLAVDIEVNDEEEAMEVAENLETFLGLHHQTETYGTVTEVIEMEDEGDCPLIPDNEYMGLA